MPNYYSSSVNWTTSVNSCQPLKKRNLLENLQIKPDKVSPTPAPAPPPFQDFLTVLNTKKRTHTSLNVNGITSDSNVYLLHQTPSPLLDHTNYKYPKIRARPIYNFKHNETNIWTQSSLNSTKFDVNILNKFFTKETKQINSNEQHTKNSSMTTTITRPFQILDKSSQLNYDVTMRHLLQLLAKNNGQNATIDDVLHGIDTGNIDNEWLQCVQRLNKTLNKHFEKRPDHKIKFETYNIENFNNINLIELFFIKLLHIPNYNFKLNCYQYRDELQLQLNLLSQSIDNLIHNIELILNNKYLPGIFQLLCYLYNIISNKSVPGLDFISLIDALNSPINQLNKTVAHVLVEILNEYYSNYLINIINDETLIELKKFISIKYEKFYIEIREIYQQYQQLEYEYINIKNQYELPLFISSMFFETKKQFDKLFQQEILIKTGEQNLANYFCSNDLTIDICLSTIGQFVDKLRLAYIENMKEKTQKISIINNERKHSIFLPINKTSSFLSCV
ncbi:unnamed protein product [Rotaria sordida]|uniref:FH2 domain-containing protein n=1 Tax=Rotaria sordida TaxID=392033 RepID=A0A818JBN1_9BILA|nr:unnamed protein product [Rotaria sordida]CAF3538520.1 unnamed protein product [Rotaria sordida]